MPRPSVSPFLLSALPPFAPGADPPHGMRVHRDEWMQVTVVDLGLEQTWPAQHSSTPIVLVALCGRAVVRIGDVEVGLSPEVLIRVAPFATYSIHAAQPCRVLVTTVFEPGPVCGV